MDGESRPGVGRAFFEKKGSITIYLDKRIHYLSRNPNLKLEVISSSFSSSQIIGGTSWFTPTSTSLLKNEEDREDEGDETNDEDKVAGHRVLAF